MKVSAKSGQPPPSYSVILLAGDSLTCEYSTFIPRGNSESQIHTDLAFSEEATWFSPAVMSCVQLTGQRKAKIPSYLTRLLPASRLMAVSSQRRRWQQLVTRLMYTMAAVAETRIFFQMYVTENVVSPASLQSMKQRWCVDLRKASWVTLHLPSSMDLNAFFSLE